MRQLFVLALPPPVGAGSARSTSKARATEPARKVSAARPRLECVKRVLWPRPECTTKTRAIETARKVSISRRLFMSELKLRPPKRLSRAARWLVMSDRGRRRGRRVGSPSHGLNQRRRIPFACSGQARSASSVQARRQSTIVRREAVVRIVVRGFMAVFFIAILARGLLSCISFHNFADRFPGSCEAPELGWHNAGKMEGAARVNLVRD